MSTLSIEARLAHHRRMAQSYYAAYARRAVKDGATYEAWQFADDAVYWSPYFGDELIHLKTHDLSVEKSATMEAKSYSLRFPDWGPTQFKCWPAENGFVMQTRFSGHRATDGVEMSFFSYGFVETNEAGEITRWETHVSEDYSAFLKVAIGVAGPFRQGANAYMEAVAKTLREAGLSF